MSGSQLGSSLHLFPVFFFPRDRLINVLHFLNIILIMLKEAFLFGHYLMFSPTVKLIWYEIDLSLEIHSMYGYGLTLLSHSCFFLSFVFVFLILSSVFFLHVPSVTWSSLSINLLADPFSNCVLCASIFDWLCVSRV